MTDAVKALVDKVKQASNSGVNDRFVAELKDLAAAVEKESEEDAIKAP